MTCLKGSKDICSLCYQLYAKTNHKKLIIIIIIIIIIAAAASEAEANERA